MFNWVVEEGSGLDELQSKLNSLSNEYAIIEIKLNDKKDWIVIGKRIQ